MIVDNEKVLKMYFTEKMRPTDIAKKLDIKQYVVSRIITKDARYTTEKEERKEKNKKKHNQNTKEYMVNKRKEVQFNNKVDDLALKNIHIQDSIELSEHKKLTNMAYRNWNISAFKYNEKRKGYEFREELGRSADVPKFIKVDLF